MKNLLNFFKPSEGRTQFFIVMGFIVVPIVTLSITFYVVVLNHDDEKAPSQRLKIPAHVLESMKKEDN